MMDRRRLWRALYFLLCLPAINQANIERCPCLFRIFANGGMQLARTFNYSLEFQLNFSFQWLNCNQWRNVEDTIVAITSFSRNVNLSSPSPTSSRICYGNENYFICPSQILTTLIITIIPSYFLCPCDPCLSPIITHPPVLSRYHHRINEVSTVMVVNKIDL